MLQEALGVESEASQVKKNRSVNGKEQENTHHDDGSEQRSSRSKPLASSQRRPSKVIGGVFGACAACVELVMCYTEGMLAWLLFGSFWKSLAQKVWPNDIVTCPIEHGLEKAAICSLWRDAGLVLAGLLSVGCMAVALSIRYSKFFDQPWTTLIRKMFPRQIWSLSGTIQMAYGIMILGFALQAVAQRATNRSIFTLDNLLDGEERSFSASRAVDLIFMAPIREVWLHFAL